MTPRILTVGALALLAGCTGEIRTTETEPTYVSSNLYFESCFSECRAAGVSMPVCDIHCGHLPSDRDATESPPDAPSDDAAPTDEPEPPASGTEGGGGSADGETGSADEGSPGGGGDDGYGSEGSGGEGSSGDDGYPEDGYGGDDGYGGYGGDDYEDCWWDCADDGWDDGV